MKWILKVVAFAFARLPLSVALGIGRGLGWIYGSAVRYHRRDALDALQRSFPEKSTAEIRDIADRMYANLGMNVMELFRLIDARGGYPGSLVETEGAEHMTEGLARGKGVIVLSAHTGNWDLLCTAAPAWGYPLTIITKRIKNKAINDVWMDIRSRYGLKFVPAHNSYRTCLTALRKNEIIGFILDQNMIRTEGIFVDYFGKPACTTPGLAYMSAQSGAPVLPVFMVRKPGGRHLVKALPLLEPPPDRKPETIHEHTQKYTRIIEDVVRENPDQWIWLHRRWRTTQEEKGAGTAAPSNPPA